MRTVITMHRLLVCVVCLLMLAPRLAPALGLGAIEARSVQYEPLDARIPLTRIRGGDLEGMRVALGSPAQFELAGVARLQTLDLLEFTVVEQDGGRGYVRIRTDEPVAAPSLTFLVEVDWRRGRMVRGYKLRLAPAVDRVAGVSANHPAAPEAERKPETDADPSTPAAQPASGSASYGPVRASETLWSIATRFRPDASVSVQRMMLALLDANPEAFAIRNVNALNAGAALRIPSRDEIGPDDLTAAVAEVERQQAAWAEYRESARAVSAPPADAAPPPRGDEPEPGGRIEVVSPETAPETVPETPPEPTGNVVEREEDAEIQSLRNELALAIEEADAGRRENDELRLRLAQVEDHVRELNRLVDLKSEEIAALQAELRSRAEAKPAPASPEAAPQPAPAEAESQPAEAPSPAPAEAGSKPMPFGLDALPINPVFLVGGAGLLLILLGVVALLRRRRATAAADEDAFDSLDPLLRDEDALDSPDPLPRDEDELLRELQAVAADLAAEKESVRLAKPDAGAGRFADPTFDLDALSREESGSGTVGRGTDDAPGAGGVAGAGEQRRSSLAGPAAGAADDPGRHLAGGGGPAAPASASATGTGEAAGPATGIPGTQREDAPPAPPPGAVSRDSGSGSAGTAGSGAGRTPAAAAGGRADVEPGSDEVSGDAGAMPRAGRDGPAGDDGAGAFPLGDFGDDEAQTKLDIAKVYVEMGDTGSARGFVEEVLAEGNAGQRKIAREMLSRLD